jgi:hypothetical protein
VPKWDLAYTLREEYDLPHLKPSTIADWAEAMQEDQEKCDKYTKNYNTNLAADPPKYDSKSCTERTCEILSPTYKL